MIMTDQVIKVNVDKVIRNIIVICVPLTYVAHLALGSTRQWKYTPRSPRSRAGMAALASVKVSRG